MLLVAGMCFEDRELYSMVFFDYVDFFIIHCCFHKMLMFSKGADNFKSC